MIICDLQTRIAGICAHSFILRRQFPWVSRQVSGGAEAAGLTAFPLREPPDPAHCRGLQVRKVPRYLPTNLPNLPSACLCGICCTHCARARAHRHGHGRSCRCEDLCYPTGGSIHRFHEFSHETGPTYIRRATSKTANEHPHLPAGVRSRRATEAARPAPVRVPKRAMERIERDPRSMVDG